MRKLVISAAVLTLSSAAFAQFGYSVQSNGDDHLYRIDLSNGVATDMGMINFGDAEGLSFDNAGNLFAIGGSVDEFWDITTPPGALVGGTGARYGTDAGLDFFNGRMYNINADGAGSEFYTINMANGTANLLGASTDFIDGLAIFNGRGFGSDGVFNDGLYSVNIANGATTFIGGFGLGAISVQTGLSFDPNGVLYMITSGGQLYTVDTSNGTATFVADVTINGTAAGGWEGFAIDPIPEPGTMLLLAGGAAALVARRRKKK